MDLVAANFLIPTGPMVLELLAWFVLLKVLELWPLVEAATRRRWRWLFAILLTGPLGGIAWLAVGRRHSSPARPVAE